jgi:5-hydroxyisourate hydrolase-like protein (transthyretin family)
VSTGNEILICASVGLLPGSTAPSYNINFWLPASTHVLISVFDSQAAFVKTLLDDDEPSNLPGQFRVPPVTWNYTDSDGKRVASGDYRIYFKAGDYLSTSDVEAP